MHFDQARGMIHRFDEAATAWEFRSRGPIAGGVEPFVRWNAFLPDGSPAALASTVAWECNGSAILRLTSDTPVRLATVTVDFDYLDDEEDY